MVFLLISGIVFLFGLSYSQPYEVCIVGAGIGGASSAHFLRKYSEPGTFGRIAVFERNGNVGGRTETVTISGRTFEAGGSIIHPKNYHAANFTDYLGLKVKSPKFADDSLSLGIWDGQKFVYKTLNSKSNLPIIQKMVSIANSIKLILRYGIFSILRMSKFVEMTLDKFMRYYESPESRPIFESVEEMLEWAGLYDLTKVTLGQALAEAGLSPRIIQELVTVITRINYGQSVEISGFAGGVSLAGSGSGLWAVEGGNWQLAAGLIQRSGVDLHLSEEITSISDHGGGVYQLNSSKGNSFDCHVVVVATPLDEVDIRFVPGITIPPRKLHHTHATFVRGLLNPAYFGMKDVSDIPDLVGTVESADIPFSSISVLEADKEGDTFYKIFSRETMKDSLLDDIFSIREETLRINWAAYPHYHAPEEYAPFVLDGKHLYYVNTFENAASAIEASAVAAENVARLAVSRLSGRADKRGASKLKTFGAHLPRLHSEL